MRGWNIVRYIVGLSIVLFIGIFLYNGVTEEATRICIRLSASIAALLFSVAFVASSIQYFFKGLFTFWLLSNRRFWGISYAILHIIHLAFLVFLQFRFHPVFDLAASTSLMAGGLAYLFTFFMLLTSFDTFRSRLSIRSWIFIHTIGGYWIWIIFMNTYISRLDTELSYLPMLIIFVFTLFMRLTKLIHSKRKASS